MKKLISALMIMTMLLTAWTIPMTVSAADAVQTSTDNILFTENFEGETNAFDANVENIAFDGVTGKVGSLAFNSEGQVIANLDIPDVYGGGVKVSYDAYLLGNGNRPIVANPAEGDADGRSCDLLQVFQRAIRPYRDGAAIYTATSDSWVKIEHSLNLDRGVTQTKVYSLTGKLLAKGAYASGCTSIGSLTFYNWGKSSAFPIDNISVETYDLTPTPGIILTENFEGATTAFDENCTIDTTTFADKKVGKIAKGKITAILDIEDIYAGSVKISYDAYLVSGGDRPISVIPAQGSDSTAKISILQVFQNKIRKVQSGDTVFTGTANNWYRIEQILNLDTAMIQTSIYSMDNVLLAECANAAGTDSIDQFTFLNNSPSTSSDFFIDNVQVEICASKPVAGVILTEDFEGETNAFNANCTNDSATFTDRTVGAVSKGNTRAVIDIEDVYSGCVKVAFDAYILGSGNRHVYLNPATALTEEVDVLQVFQRKVNKKTSGDTIHTGTAESWIRIEQYLDLDKGTVRTMVLDGTKLVGATYELGCNSIGSITFRNESPATSVDFYIDNLEIAIIDLNPEQRVLKTEDFESADNALDTNCVNKEFEGKKVGEIFKGTAGSVSSVLDFEDVYGGMVKLSLDAYAYKGDTNVNCTIKAHPAGESASVVSYNTVQAFQNRLRPVIDNSVDIYDGKNGNGWYHLEQVLDLNSGTVTTAVYTADQAELLGTKTESIGCYSLGQLSFLSQGSHPFYMDNVTVEIWRDRPEVVEISAYDIYGQKVENLAGASYVVDVIQVTFDEAISQTTPSTYFVLQDADGNALNFAGAINESVYTLTMKDALLPESVYTFTVSENVMDTEGNIAGQTFSTILTTIAAEDITSNVQINTFTRADGELTVDAAYINGNEEEIPMVFIIAFYDEDGNMIGINTPRVKDSSKAYGRLSMTFADYAGTETVAETKLFCWDSLDSMTPYIVTETL